MMTLLMPFGTCWYTTHSSIATDGGVGGVLDHGLCLAWIHVSVSVLLGWSLEAIVFGSIRWCVWSVRPSSPLRLPHLKCLLLLVVRFNAYQIVVRFNAYQISASIDAKNNGFTRELRCPPVLIYFAQACREAGVRLVSGNFKRLDPKCISA